jgi:hypothetical protein
MMPELSSISWVTRNCCSAKALQLAKQKKTKRREKKKKKTIGEI